MATIKKYNGSTWENTTARKYETKSEIITPPTTIYTDGTAITSYTIKGNTVRNGTPTPSNPVDVVGVGTLDSGQYKIPISSGGVTTNIYLGSTQTVRQVRKLVLTGEETDWTLQSINSHNIANFGLSIPEAYRDYQSNVFIFSSHYVQQTTRIADTETVGITIGGDFPSHILYVRENATNYANATAFKQYLATQYAAGTPVTVWYVLATPETAAVNEPLMKIGDYADTLSNAAQIPTTEGANSIIVDTTVQPSEFTATWTGWHDASVKEWDGSQWNE